VLFEEGPEPVVAFYPALFDSDPDEVAVAESDKKNDSFLPTMTRPRELSKHLRSHLLAHE
jgi:hypothetical protein